MSIALMCRSQKDVEVPFPTADCNFVYIYVFMDCCLLFCLLFCFTKGMFFILHRIIQFSISLHRLADENKHSVLVDKHVFGVMEIITMVKMSRKVWCN